MHPETQLSYDSQKALIRHMSTDQRLKTLKRIRSKSWRIANGAIPWKFDTVGLSGKCLQLNGTRWYLDFVFSEENPNPNSNPNPEEQKRSRQADRLVENKTKVRVSRGGISREYIVPLCLADVIKQWMRMYLQNGTVIRDLNVSDLTESVPRGAKWNVTNFVGLMFSGWQYVHPAIRHNQLETVTIYHMFSQGYYFKEPMIRGAKKLVINCEFIPTPDNTRLAIEGLEDLHCQQLLFENGAPADVVLIGLAMKWIAQKRAVGTSLILHKVDVDVLLRPGYIMLMHYNAFSSRMREDREFFPTFTRPIDDASELVIKVSRLGQPEQENFQLEMKVHPKGTTIPRPAQMTANRPVAYQALKAILEQSTLVQRKQLARHIPSIRPTDAVIPLDLDSVHFYELDFEVNEQKWAFEWIREQNDDVIQFMPGVCGLTISSPGPRRFHMRVQLEPLAALEKLMRSYLRKGTHVKTVVLWYIPDNLSDDYKIKVDKVKLENCNYDNFKRLLPIIEPTEQLKSIKFIVRQETLKMFEEPMVINSQKIRLQFPYYNSQPIDNIFLNLQNREIHVIHINFPIAEVQKLATHWIRTQRAVGSKFYLWVEEYSYVLDVMELMATEIEAIPSRVKELGNSYFAHCVTLPINACSELVINGAGMKSKWPPFRWTFKMEVMARGSTIPKSKPE
ncbi:unnamed protein product [Caenorhabditis sp. 36 PRJEB53466]|nr:unnamed protein product [Caenorhabditis sp. 36 PRJEB53466]